jgi:hypothetical protein
MGPQPSTTRIVTVGLLRAAAATALILTLYFVLPLDRVADVPAVVSLPLALAGFTVMMVLQIQSIVRSPQPGLRAVEALAISLPLFLVVFAATYYVLGVSDPTWFSESLSKLDALYFTVTVFATVGFGDIAASSPPARVAVTVQMVADLVVLGVGVRVLTGAVREARARAGRPLPGAP